jgi:NADPH:quinone reductase-like Zn-dependent oxidoreductase
VSDDPPPPPVATRAIRVRMTPLTPREHRVREGRRRALGDPEAAAERVVVGTSEEGVAVAVLGTSERRATLSVASDAVVPLPGGLAPAVAAATLDPLLEALTVVGALGRLRRSTVLVTDGATALGRLLVACAARGGARVTAVLPAAAPGPATAHASSSPRADAAAGPPPSPHDGASAPTPTSSRERPTSPARRSPAEALRAAGAEEIVDARHTPYAVLPQFDVVLTEVDEPGPLHEHHPLHQALAATRRRGTLVPLGAPAPEDAAAKRVRVLPTPPAPTAADLRRAVDALAAGLVDPLPPRVFPVADRTAAHAALAADGERRGAVVLAWA